MRDIRRAVARELAETFLTQIDLNSSLASLTLWSKQYCRDEQDPNPDHTTISDSLFRDGITQFVACFDGKTNVYPLVVEIVYPAVDGIGPYFRWLRALRNSFTAHRHGSGRQYVVGAVLNPETGEYVGPGRLCAIYKGPSREGHQPLLALIQMAINYVNARIEALEKQFDLEARAIPAAELANLPPAAVQPQAPEDMAKSRGDILEKLTREHTKRPA